MKNYLKYFYLYLIILISCSTLNSNISEEKLKKIFDKHCLQLKNTHIKHSPFFITFSGTPGMGKTFVAQELEDKYKAVRIRTDDIRSLIESNFSNQLKKKDFENILEQYLKYFFKKYNLPNKRFILDASIDRRYKQLFPYFKTNNIKFLVIRLQVPRDLIINRIKEREGCKSDWYLKNLDSWLHDYNDFKIQYQDFIFYENNKESIDNKLFLEIDKIIKY